MGQTITCAIPAALDMDIFTSNTPSAIDYAEGHSPWEDLYGTYVVKCHYGIARTLSTEPSRHDTII